MDTHSEPGLYPYTVFLSLAFCAFIAAHYGFEILADICAGLPGIGESVYSLLPFSAAQVFFNLILLCPFMLHACLAASLGKKNWGHAKLFFAAGCMILMGLFLMAHFDSANAMIQKRWTAAALSMGFLSLECLPVLIVLGLIRLYLGFRISPR